PPEPRPAQLPPPPPALAAAPRPAGGPDPLPAPRPLPGPFEGAEELTPDALVEQGLARSPSLPPMVAAWPAAPARHPQVTSLDDPLFGATLAPGRLGPQKPQGYRLEVFQRYPWPGKLRLRGEVALAEASAAGRDVEDVRQQLIESARD